MVHDEYEVTSETHKALINIAEDKSELCPIDHAIQYLDSKVTVPVFDNCNYSQHYGHSNKNTITRHSQVEQRQLAKMVERNQKESDDSSLCNTTGKSFYTDKQYSNLETAMNRINIPEISNNNYDIILEEGNNNNLPEQTVLYIMNLMFNNIYLRLINGCNNTLNIAEKHKVKGFNFQDIGNNIEQFEILRENINTEFNKLLIEKEPGVQYKNIFTLLHEQPELLFAQIIDLQNSLKEFELLFSDLQDINGTIKRLQKCVNVADALLLSDTEQVSFKDINTKNAKNLFNRLMNIASVANMLCDSLAEQDIAGANPQYFIDLSTKINKIKKGLYINDLARNMLFDFNNKYSQLVNDIFSDNTLCLNTLDKIQTNIRNYTTRDTFDSSRKSAANAEIKFLSAGMKFIVERVDAMIEPYFKPKDVVCNSKTTKQQDINNKHHSINNAYVRNINTPYSNELLDLNTNTFEDPKPTNIHSTEIENPNLHVRTKRSTDTITDTAPLSNESNLTNVVVDIINNDHNNTSTSMESESSTHELIQDTPNDLINKMNIAINTNLQTTHIEPKIEQKDHKEQVAHRVNPNVQASDLASTSEQPQKITVASKIISTTKNPSTNTNSAPKKYTNLHANSISLNMENESSTHELMQDTPNDLINKMNIAINTNLQTTHIEPKIEQKDHKEQVAHQVNTNVQASDLASTSEQPQKIMVASKIISTTQNPSANTNSAPKKYTNLHANSSLADIAVRSDIITTGTFTSITYKYKIHNTINSARTVQLNDKDSTYNKYNIQNSDNGTHYIPAYQLVVDTTPAVNIYNKANIITSTNTNTTSGEYNTKTPNSNNINHMEYIVGHRNPISNNLANNNMQPDNLTLYNGITTLQYQQLYYNITLPSNTIYHPKLNVSNFISSYKSSRDKEEKVEKRTCDKILIDHTGYNTRRKEYYSFLDALNDVHKLFNMILACTDTYQELYKQYPNKSIKELLLTSSLINNLDADERQNLTKIYGTVNKEILVI